MPTDPFVPKPEFEFIDWVEAQTLSKTEVRCGIGDDAAVVRVSTDSELVTAVDVITEGVHFTADSDPFLIGRKALAINLSDIAAMGAEPIAAFIGIVLPNSRNRKYAEEIYRGLFEIANTYGVAIAGGDTNSWSGGLVISVTVQGSVRKGQAILRSGANPGDWVFVTGALGGSLHSGRHFQFEPRLKEARMLISQFRPTAMLDISDGIASDVFHLAQQSKVGMTLESEQIPIHPDVDQSLDCVTRVKHALNDGEDFELLFTVSPQVGRKLMADSKQFGLNVTRIGTCTEGSDVLLEADGQVSPLLSGGWSHKI